MLDLSIACSWAAHEMQTAIIPDERQRNNLVKMCLQVASQPEQSFSSACGTALRKAAWRLFSASDLQLMQGHYQATVARLENQPFILIAQDTTDISLPSHKATIGLGYLGGNHGFGLGLSMHSGLVISQTGEPLGLIDQQIWAPTNQGRTKKHYTYRLQEKESYRWVELLDNVKERLATYTGRILVIADREADFYEHFAWRRAANTDLLIRAHHLQRKVHWQGQLLSISELTEKIIPAGCMQLQVKSAKTAQPRMARLQIGYASIDLPAASQRKGPCLPLQLVYSQEIDCPDGEDPLRWVLLTSLAVDDLPQAMQVLEYYSQRWLIERFHYVFKQGLQVERLQFDEAQRLKHALQICSIVAWRLMWLTYQARVDPQQSASTCFEAQEIEILEALGNQKSLTVQQAILILASLVGFRPSKKQPLPGLKVCWKAWKAFKRIQQGYNINKINYGT